MPLHPLETVAGLQTAQHDNSTGNAVADDIYALGVVLHETAAGQLPFPVTVTDGSLISQARESLAGRTNIAETVRADTALPSGLRSIIATCLTEDGTTGDKHYETAQQLADDLTCYLEHRPTAHAAETTSERLGRLWNRYRRKLTPATVIVTLTLCAFGIDRWSVLQGLSEIDTRRQATTLDVSDATKLQRALFDTGTFPDSTTLQRRRANVAHGVAVLLLSQEQPESALQLLLQVVKLDPEDGAAHNDLGTAYFKLTQYANAVTAFDRALERQCDHSAVHSNRGAAYAAMRRYKEAKHDFQQALQINGNNTDAQTHLEMLQQFL